MIRGAEVNNIVIVVTRYFGGTLLGTGGLVRAYTDAAKEAIDASVIHTVMHIMAVKIEIDYTDVGRINYIVMNKGYETEAPIFTDKVSEIIFKKKTT